MRLTAHPERLSGFERFLREQQFIHGVSAPHSPWQNAIIERSHRTDNEEFFRCFEFQSSEERKYRLRLWEYEYNNRRPHMGLGGETPIQVYRKLYFLHARSRELI